MGWVCAREGTVLVPRAFGSDTDGGSRGLTASTGGVVLGVVVVAGRVVFAAAEVAAGSFSMTEAAVEEEEEDADSVERRAEEEGEGAEAVEGVSMVQARTRGRCEESESGACRSLLMEVGMEALVLLDDLVGLPEEEVAVAGALRGEASRRGERARGELLDEDMGGFSSRWVRGLGLLVGGEGLAAGHVLSLLFLANR